MNRNLVGKQPWTSTLLALALAALGLAVGERPQAATNLRNPGAAAASVAQGRILPAAPIAAINADELWRRIDEQRLVNRTPDQIVAWVIMGLLAAGLLRRFTKLKEAAALPIGLVGAFLGGIVVNVTGLNLGLGPVLIRYEDLLVSLVGALLILLAARWFAARRESQ